jgi:hypothetical protein
MGGVREKRRRRAYIGSKILIFGKFQVDWDFDWKRFPKNQIIN